MIRITPDPILFELGPLQVGWYGVAFVVGLAVLLLVTMREVERRGIDRNHVWNATLLVGALALLGGRLYHVIHEWDLYRDNLLSVFLPIRPDGGFGFAGLGLFGGVAGAALGIILYTRWKRLSLRLALDSVIPGTLFAQGIARWGNFFNQELYGPPTEAPWGIAIDCLHRVAEYPCSLYPFETTGFQPLFFYESVLNILGGFVALYISRRWLHRIQPGDIAALWGIWYGLTRTWLEVFREGWNWTISGIATAQLVGIGVALIGVAWIVWNHRPGTSPYPYPEPSIGAVAGSDDDFDWDQDEEDDFDDEFDDAEDDFAAAADTPDEPAAADSPDEPAATDSPDEPAATDTDRPPAG